MGENHNEASVYGRDLPELSVVQPAPSRGGEQLQPPRPPPRTPPKSQGTSHGTVSAKTWLAMIDDASSQLSTLYSFIFTAVLVLGIWPQITDGIVAHHLFWLLVVEFLTCLVSLALVRVRRGNLMMTPAASLLAGVLQMLVLIFSGGVITARESGSVREFAVVLTYAWYGWPVIFVSVLSKVQSKLNRWAVLFAATPYLLAEMFAASEMAAAGTSIPQLGSELLPSGAAITLTVLFFVFKLVSFSLVTGRFLVRALWNKKFCELFGLVLDVLVAIMMHLRAVVNLALVEWLRSLDAAIPSSVLEQARQDEREAKARLRDLAQQIKGILQFLFGDVEPAPMPVYRTDDSGSRPLQDHQTHAVVDGAVLLLSVMVVHFFGKHFDCAPSCDGVSTDVYSNATVVSAMLVFATAAHMTASLVDVILSLAGATPKLRDRFLIGVLSLQLVAGALVVARTYRLRQDGALDTKVPLFRSMVSCGVVHVFYSVCIIVQLVYQQCSDKRMCLLGPYTRKPDLYLLVLEKLVEGFIVVAHFTMVFASCVVGLVFFAAVVVGVILAVRELT